MVIFQAGRCPIKVSRGKLLDEPGMNAAVVTTLATRSLAAGVTAGAGHEDHRPGGKPDTEIQDHGQTRSSTSGWPSWTGQVETEILENIEYTAIKNLEDDYGRLRGEVAASIVTKAIVSLAAGIGAQEATRKLSKGNSGLSALMGLMVGAGTGTALFATMKPDLRCWHTLPANLQLATDAPSAREVHRHHPVHRLQRRACRKQSI